MSLPAAHRDRGARVASVSAYSPRLPRGAACIHHRRRQGAVMARYGKKAQSKVKRAMHERKEGTLRSGRSGKRVTSRKQAIAIGLSEARKAGGKVPRRKGATRKTAKKR